MQLLHRKLYRLCSLFFVFLLIFTSSKITLLILSFFLIILFLLEALRFKYKKINEKIFTYFSSFLKEKEKKIISSTTIYFLSMFLVVLLFSKEVAIASLLILIFADIFSALAGTRWGKIKITRSKTLEGTIAFFLTCLIIGFILRYLNFPFEKKAILLCALGTSMVELIPYLDDNLTVPLVAGFILEILK
jgi:dolichol kinase